MTGKRLILNLVILTSCNVFGQKLCSSSLDSSGRKEILTFKKEYKLNLLDTVFIYHTYHTWDTSTSCTNLTTEYFFWSKGFDTYFTIKDACFDYEQLKIDRSFFHYFFQIKDSLLTERLMSPPCYVDDAGILWLIASDNRTEFSASFPTEYFHHYCGHDSIIKFNNQSQLKKFHDFLLIYVKELSNKIERQKKRNKRTPFNPYEFGTPAEFENKDAQKRQKNYR